MNRRAVGSAVAQKEAARKAAAEVRAMEEKLARMEEEHRRADLKALADWQASNKTQTVSAIALPPPPHSGVLTCLRRTVGRLDLCCHGNSPPIRWWSTRGQRRVKLLVSTRVTKKRSGCDVKGGQRAVFGRPLRPPLMLARPHRS